MAEHQSAFSKRKKKKKKPQNRMTTLSVPPYERSLEATILYLPCRSQRKLMQLHLLTQQVIKYRLLLVTKLDLIVTKLILSLCKILSFHSGPQVMRSKPLLRSSYSPAPVLMNHLREVVVLCRPLCRALKKQVIMLPLCLLHNTVSTCLLMPADIGKEEC